MESAITNERMEKIKINLSFFLEVFRFVYEFTIAQVSQRVNSKHTRNKNKKREKKKEI